MVMQSGLTEAGTARPWPAERIEYWAIERLIPYASNARLHSEGDREAPPIGGSMGPLAAGSPATAKSPRNK